jgi:hypothetical protein
VAVQDGSATKRSNWQTGIIPAAQQQYSRQLCYCCRCGCLSVGQSTHAERSKSYCVLLSWGIVLCFRQLCVVYVFSVYTLRDHGCLASLLRAVTSFTHGWDLASCKRWLPDSKVFFLQLHPCVIPSSHQAVCAGLLLLSMCILHYVISYIGIRRHLTLQADAPCR